MAWLGAPSFPSLDSFPSVDLALAPLLLPCTPQGCAVPHMSCSSPRHELSGLRQPDTGSAAGPHGAVPDALARGEAGPAVPPPSVFPSLPFLCLVPDFSLRPGLCGPLPQSSGASPYLPHFPRSPWAEPPRTTRLTWTCLWKGQPGKSPESKVPAGSSEHVPPGLSLPSRAPGLILRGSSHGPAGTDDWHFQISNLGVLGAQEAERAHGGFGLSGCPPSHRPFSSPFP